MNGLSERLYQDWQKLGLALGLKMVVLDRLSNQSRVHAERWPLRMLQVWRETADIRPVQELAQALQEMERADLVQLLRLGIMDTDGGRRRLILRDRSLITQRGGGGMGGGLHNRKVAVRNFLPPANQDRVKRFVSPF